MSSSYAKLEETFKRLHAFSHLGAITSWDEAVNMPPKSGEARAEALSELYAYITETIQKPEMKDWIHEAKGEKLSELQKANLREIEKQWNHSNALSVDFVKRKSRVNMSSEQAWRSLRAENNWQAFRPKLEEVVELVREEAAIRADQTGLSHYDALLDMYEPGLRCADVDRIFQTLKSELPGLRDRVLEHQLSRNIQEPQGPFPVEKQKALGMKIMKAIGFDFDRGRLDVSHHPFCGGVPQDIRMTTRYTEVEFVESLMGIIHESGHAMYEQNLPKEWISQPLGQSKGMAVHEGQSLFYEMQMGRGREFLEYVYPLMQKHLQSQKDDSAWSLENITNLYQKVEPGLIRVNADEVTYPFHILLRYEIERDLLDGKIEVKDLPELWNSKMNEYLSLDIGGDYQNGVMQDVHWPAGAIGYFPTYTLGALVAAQLYQTLEKSVPETPTKIKQGNFDFISQWLRENIWSHGSRYSMQELMTKATGKELEAAPFLEHISRRYLN